MLSAVELRERNLNALLRIRKCLSGQPSNEATQAQIALVLEIIEEKGGSEVISHNPIVRETAAKRIEQARSKGRRVRQEVKFPEAVQLDLQVGTKLSSLAQHAASNGLALELTHADVKRMFARKRCEYTKTEFDDTKRPQFTRVFTRRDPTKGWTKENTVICSKSAQSLKDQLFHDQDSDIFMDDKQFGNFVLSAFAEQCEG
jgi:hypothetical protein